jgi:uncharacterized protein (TIGR00299 family) protein
MHIHLDPIGGIAGDMFIAAVLDAWPEWQAELFAALGLCGLPAGWQPKLTERRQHAIAGRHFALVPPPVNANDSGAFRDIRARLAASDLDEAVKTHAIGIFTLLAEAEAAIHAVPVDEVHFHELADWDSIADIVGAAWLIARAGARSWSVGPLPLGGGTVMTAHDLLPVPAPATTRLLQGFAVIDDGVPGERVTPTGAAIVRYLAPVPRRGIEGRLLRTGHGLGTRDLPDRANLLRLLALDTESESIEFRAVAEQVVVLSFFIDDQSAEDLAVALDHLRALPGVLEVTQAAVLGKKGRLVQDVQILCVSDALSDVSKRCFLETTTIGLRWHLEQRLVLPRTALERNGLRVKRVERPGGRMTTKAEIDDVKDLESHAERCALRRSAEHKDARDD